MKRTAFSIDGRRRHILHDGSFHRQNQKLTTEPTDSENIQFVQ
jgi:hypothetical protein